MRKAGSQEMATSWFPAFLIVPHVMRRAQSDEPPRLDERELLLPAPRARVPREPLPAERHDPELVPSRDRERGPAPIAGRSAGRLAEEELDLREVAAGPAREEVERAPTLARHLSGRRPE